MTFHLFHENVIRFDGRPDKSVKEMNARIIDTTNEYVKENDLFAYHGDFCFAKDLDRHDNDGYCVRVKSCLDQLRCKNILFVCGNHDRTYIKKDGYRLPNWTFWDLFKSKHPLCGIYPMGYELHITRRLCAEQDLSAEFDGKIIVLSHYAHRHWNRSHHEGDRAANLHGHSHGSLPGFRNQIDVGFNIWNRPLSLVEILTDILPKHNATKPEYIPHHKR